MKSFTLVVTMVMIIGFLFILSTPAAAETLCSIGYSSDYDAIGLSAVIPLRNDMYAVEIGWMFNYEILDALDYPCPHYDYTVLNDSRFSYGAGADILARINISDNLRVYAGAGVYFLFYQEIVMSNATGWVYIQSESLKVEPAFSCGVLFDKFGVGYHSIRGIAVNFTVPF